MATGTDLIGTMDGDITQIIGTILIGVLVTVGDIHIMAATIVHLFMVGIIIHIQVMVMGMEIRSHITEAEEILIT